VKLSSLAYRLLGFVALGCAVVGAILPVMPTTVFVILAAWCFAKGSPKLHARLMAHPKFGPVLANWEAHGAIPRSAKIAAVMGMLLSLGIVLTTVRKPWVIALTVVILGCSAAYVLTRPAPPTEMAARAEIEAERES